MPRKCPFKALFYGACKGVGFRNNNPDKGTETLPAIHHLYIVFSYLEIITPIRGRKQFIKSTILFSSVSFRNNNPDKGTETFCLKNLAKSPIKNLEIITPIRGRKHIPFHYRSMSVPCYLEIITPIRGRKHI